MLYLLEPGDVAAGTVALVADKVNCTEEQNKLEDDKDNTGDHDSLQVVLDGVLKLVLAERNIILLDLSFGVVETAFCEPVWVLGAVQEAAAFEVLLDSNSGGLHVFPVPLVVDFIEELLVVKDGHGDGEGLKHDHDDDHDEVQDAAALLLAAASEHTENCREDSKAGDSQDELSWDLVLDEFSPILLAELDIKEDTGNERGNDDDNVARSDDELGELRAAPHLRNDSPAVMTGDQIKRLMDGCLGFKVVLGNWSDRVKYFVFNLF